MGTKVKNNYPVQGHSVQKYRYNFTKTRAGSTKFGFTIRVLILSMKVLMFRFNQFMLTQMTFHCDPYSAKQAMGKEGNADKTGILSTQPCLLNFFSNLAADYFLA